MTLRITFEIVPFGDESRAYKIHQLEIHNLGTKTAAGATRYAADLDGERINMTFLHKREEGALKLAKVVLNKMPLALAWLSRRMEGAESVQRAITEM